LEQSRVCGRRKIAERNWFLFGYRSFLNVAGTATDLKPWLEGAAINSDRNLRLQYLAGLGLNLYQANPIYVNMTSPGIRFPDENFTGSDNLLEMLRYSIEAGQRP
jgi:hypothetical protein